MRKKALVIVVLVIALLSVGACAIDVKPPLDGPNVKIQPVVDATGPAPKTTDPAGRIIESPKETAPKETFPRPTVNMNDLDWDLAKTFPFESKAGIVGLILELGWPPEEVGLTYELLRGADERLLIEFRVIKGHGVEKDFQDMATMYKKEGSLKGEAATKWEGYVKMQIESTGNLYEDLALSVSTLTYDHTGKQVLVVTDGTVTHDEYRIFDR